MCVCATVIIHSSEQRQRAAQEEREQHIREEQNDADTVATMIAVRPYPSLHTLHPNSESKRGERSEEHRRLVAREAKGMGQNRTLNRNSDPKNDADTVATMIAVHPDTPTMPPCSGRNSVKSLRSSYTGLHHECDRWVLIEESG